MLSQAQIQANIARRKAQGHVYPQRYSGVGDKRKVAPEPFMDAVKSMPVAPPVEYVHRAEVHLTVDTSTPAERARHSHDPDTFNAKRNARKPKRAPQGPTVMSHSPSRYHHREF
jgi:hypothetical protein